MGLILPELLAQLNINPGTGVWDGKRSHFHKKKYELEFIDTARKKVQLSSELSTLICLYEQNYFTYVLSDSWFLLCDKFSDETKKLKPLFS